MSSKLTTPTVLKKIIDRKVEEVADRKCQQDLSTVKGLAMDASPSRGFISALQRLCAVGHAVVIAEV